MWGGVELSEHDYEITLLFSLSMTVQAFGIGIYYSIDYSIVKDWCDRYDEDSLYILTILKDMVSVLNEKK